MKRKHLVILLFVVVILLVFVLVTLFITNHMFAFRSWKCNPDTETCELVPRGTGDTNTPWECNAGCATRSYNCGYDVYGLPICIKTEKGKGDVYKSECPTNYQMSEQCTFRTWLADESQARNGNQKGHTNCCRTYNGFYDCPRDEKGFPLNRALCKLHGDFNTKDECLEDPGSQKRVYMCDPTQGGSCALINGRSDLDCSQVYPEKLCSQFSFGDAQSCQNTCQKWYPWKLNLDYDNNKGSCEFSLTEGSYSKCSDCIFELYKYVTDDDKDKLGTWATCPGSYSQSCSMGPDCKVPITDMDGVHKIEVDINPQSKESFSADPDPSPPSASDCYCEMSGYDCKCALCPTDSDPYNCCTNYVNPIIQGVNRACKCDVPITS